LADDPNFQNIAARWTTEPGSDAYRGVATTHVNRYLYGPFGAADSLGYPGVFNTATVGASGAVFGLLFAFGYLFPNTLLYFYFFVPIKAKYFVALYAAFELFAGFRNSGSDNVAHFAHIGGMIVGFLLLRAWGIRRFSRRY
jgi:membrane associated rhomboid family serine protease